MGERTYENGDERRTLSYGENADGTVYVRQTSEGDLTRRGDDCYITDYAEALELWGVEFVETQECELLMA